MRGERTRLGRATRWWWVRLPCAALRLSRALSAAVADGHFLAGYPLLGAVVTPAAAVGGLLFGGLRIGYYRSFSESLALVVTAAVLGHLATQLGTAFVAGFAVGDFFAGQTSWIYRSGAGGPLGHGLLAGLLRIRVPMLIAYLLLASLAVALPALVRGLLAGIPGVSRLPGNLGFGVAMLLNLVLVYLGVQVWAHAAAVLVRPLYTWSVRLTIFGAPIPPEQIVAPQAVRTLQRDGLWIVRAAVIATLARYGLVWLSLRVPALARRVRRVEAELAEAVPVRPLAERAGALPVAVLTAAASTLVLAGLIQAWWVALLYFTELLLLRALSLGLLPPRVDAWRRLVARIPLALRLAVALLTVRAVASALVGRSESFTPMALFVASAVAALYLLMPGQPLPREAA